MELFCVAAAAAASSSVLITAQLPNGQLVSVGQLLAMLHGQDEGMAALLLGDDSDDDEDDDANEPLLSAEIDSVDEDDA